MRRALQSWMFLIRLSAVWGLGLISAFAVVAAAIFATTQRGAPWRGDLVWTIDWLSVGFVIGGPLVAGAAALDVGRMARGTLHLEGRWPWRSPGLGVAIGHASLACIGHLVGLGAALIMSLPPVTDPFAWLAVLVQLLLLVLFVSLGAAVGRLTQPVLAGLVASSAVLLLIYFFGSPSDQITILNTGQATLPRIGYAYHWTYLAVQAAIIVVLIVASWILRPASPISSRHVGWGRVLVSVVLAVASVGLGLAITLSRLVPTGRPPTYCGAVQTRPVCYYPEHARVSNQFSETLWAIVEMTEHSDYQDLLPQRFAEVSRTWAPTDPGTAPFILGDEQLAGGPPDVTAILQGIVEPLHCAQLATDALPSERYMMDLQRLISTWESVVTEDTSMLVGDPLPAEEALALRDQFATCSYPYFTEPS